MSIILAWRMGNFNHTSIKAGDLPHESVGGGISLFPPSAFLYPLLGGLASADTRVPELAVLVAMRVVGSA